MTNLVTDKPNPWWVTGLVDGEGCFYAGLSFRDKKSSSGDLVSCVNLVTELSIGLRADDRPVLDRIHDHFGCGEIRWKRSANGCESTKRAGIVNARPQVTFKIRKLTDLVGVVIPHFEAFPLQSKKFRDFEIWKEIVRFAHAELSGSKGWLRRYPEKVDVLDRMCVALKEERAYRQPTGLN